MLSPADRIAHYEAHSGFPGSLFVGADGRIYGTWVMGNNYRVKSSYYGGYPPTYLRRIKALFPDKHCVAHLFSGRVDTAELPGTTIDSNPEVEPDILDDAHRLETAPVESYDLVLADPPYSVEDCDHYQCTMVKRNVVMRTLGQRLPRAPTSSGSTRSCPCIVKPTSRSSPTSAWSSPPPPLPGHHDFREALARISHR